MVQNHQTEEQMTQWDILNKVTKFEFFFCFTCPSASFALQFGDFVPRDCSVAKGPLVDEDDVHYA